MALADYDINDYPFAKEVALKVKPVMVGCSATKELYGYFKPVVSIDMTLVEFSRAYAKEKFTYGHRYPATVPNAREMQAAKNYFSTLTA